MASEADTPLNHPDGPNFSQRLWSEEVAIASANAGEPLQQKETAYVFSNGRTFRDPERPV